MSFQYRAGDLVEVKHEHVRMRDLDEAGFNYHMVSLGVIIGPVPKRAGFVLVNVGMRNWHVDQRGIKLIQGLEQ